MQFLIVTINNTKIQVSTTQYLQGSNPDEPDIMFTTFY